MGAFWFMDLNYHAYDGHEILSVVSHADPMLTLVPKSCSDRPKLFVTVNCPILSVTETSFSIDNDTSTTQEVDDDFQYTAECLKLDLNHFLLSHIHSKGNTKSNL